MRYRQFSDHPIRSILPAPKKSLGAGWVAANNAKHMRALPHRTTFHAWGWSDSLSYYLEFCKEHERAELVPNGNYWNDLRVWYRIERHPRFSALEVLYQLGARMREAQGLLNSLAILNILKTTNTARQFAKAVRPHLPVWCRIEGTPRRVSQTFADKYQNETFTAQDWLKESNHELRRWMLRRGVQLSEVLKKLHLVATDNEGKLYHTSRDWSAAQRQPQYLYVTCPSTGQEYLLGVPHNITVTPGGWHQHDWVPAVLADIDTPAKARRWTFNLPLEDATFVAEA